MTKYEMYRAKQSLTIECEYLYGLSSVTIESFIRHHFQHCVIWRFAKASNTDLDSTILRLANDRKNFKDINMNK